MAVIKNHSLSVSMSVSFLLHGAVLLAILGAYHAFNPEDQLLQLTEIEFVEVTPPEPEGAKPSGGLGSMLGRTLAKGRRLLPALSAPLISKASLSVATSADVSAAPKDTVRLVSHDVANVKQVIPPGWIQADSGKIPVSLKSGAGINLNQTGKLSLGSERSSLLGDAGLPTGSGLGGGQGLILRKGDSAESLLKQIQKGKGLGLGDGEGTGGGSGKMGFKDAYAITGEIKSREVLHIEMPVYPPWAEEQGIEAEVTLRVRVEPDGAVVASSIYVLKTSGYTELDRLAKEALSRWYFAPLSKNEKQRDQVGEVRFAFRLKRG